MEKQNPRPAFNFASLLTLLLIGLKLTGHFDESWWWVFAPLWLPAAVVVIIVGVIATVVYISDRNQY